MKNVVVCKNCASENPFYELICNNCKSYLRERIYNIDLWKTIGLLIESPTVAFKLIIYSEHKNFLILAFILISGKMFLNGIFMNVYLLNRNAYIPSLLSGYIITLVLTIIMLLLFAALLSLLTKKFVTKTRYFDNFSIITYSFLPFSLGFLVLFPVELILFGQYLFYINPSPFLLKETLAYTLLIFEVLILLWSIFLTFKAINIQTRSPFYSIIFTIFIHFTFNFFLYLTATTLYL